MQLHYGVGRICAHATYTSGVAFQSSFSIVKLAISETRMKAETLSWSMWLATAQTRFGPQDMAKIGIIIGLPKKTEKKCRREVGNDFSLAYHKVQMPFGRSRFKVELRSTLVATRPFVSKLPMALAASRVQSTRLRLSERRVKLASTLPNRRQTEWRTMLAWALLRCEGGRQSQREQARCSQS